MNTIDVISETEYRELKARVQVVDAWVDSIRSKRKCRKCRGTGILRRGFAVADSIYCPNCEQRGYVLGWASYKPEDMPENVKAMDVSNAERSKIEVYEFVRDRPKKYTAYVSIADQIVTTWTGDVLGRITWVGHVYETSVYGGANQRQNLRVVGVNGVVYSAVYYRSSGDYCRMKAFRSSEVSKSNQGVSL